MNEQNNKVTINGNDYLVDLNDSVQVAIVNSLLKNFQRVEQAKAIIEELQPSILTGISWVESTLTPVKAEEDVNDD